MKLKLSKSTYKSLSDICISAGQVCFGVGVGGFSLLKLDSIEVLVVLSYLLLGSGFWLLAIYFAQKGKI